MKLQALHEFVKNLSAPCCVVTLVKGMAINCERRLAGHAEIVQKSMFNYGVQVERFTVASTTTRR